MKGIFTSDWTGLSLTILGRNLLFLAASMAAGFRTGFGELTTVAFVTLPFSSIVTLTVTVPLIPSRAAISGYLGRPISIASGGLLTPFEGAATLDDVGGAAAG